MCRGEFAASSLRFRSWVYAESAWPSRLRLLMVRKRNAFAQRLPKPNCLIVEMKIIRCKRFSFIGLLIALVAPILCGYAGQPGLLMNEFIFETAPFPQCHASTIVESKDGFV